MKNLEIPLRFHHPVQPWYQDLYLLSERFKNIHVKTFPLQ